VVCGLSSLMRNFMSSSSCYCNDCNGQQGTLPRPPPLRGDDGYDDDGCSSGWGAMQRGGANKAEGYGVVCELLLTHDFMSSTYHNGNNSGGQHGTLPGSPSLQGDDGDDDDGCSSGRGVMPRGRANRRGGNDVLCAPRCPPPLCSPSSLASTLGQIPTPLREAYFSVLMRNVKYVESLNKVSEPVTRSLNFGCLTQQSNMILPLPRTPNPFNYHLPHKHGGCHRLIGQDPDRFNLRQAADKAAARWHIKLIKTFLSTGNPEQRKKTLTLFLTKKKIMKDTTKSILSDVLFDKEAIAGVQCLRSMKLILNKLFRSHAGRISAKKGPL
jgi:hypothetical protein